VLRNRWNPSVLNATCYGFTEYDSAQGKGTPAIAAKINLSAHLGRGGKIIVTLHKLNLRQLLSWAAIFLGLFVFVLATHAEESLSISLTSDPTSPVKEVGTQFKVIIEYRIDQGDPPDNVQVFYWIPDGLRYISSDPERTPDPEDDRQPLRWDIDQDFESTRIVITLEITDPALLDQQSQHRAAINAQRVESVEEQLPINLVNPTLATPTTQAETSTPEARPDLQITHMEPSSNVIRPGETVTLTITLKNEGDIEASNIKLLLDTPESGFAFANDPILPDSLAPGVAHTYFVPIQALVDAPDNSYEIFVKLSLGEDSTPIVSEEIRIQIEGPKTPNYVEVNQNVIVEEDNRARLRFEFRNDGGTEGAVQIVLHYASGSIEVIGSQLNGQSFAGALQADREGYAWLIDEPGDWRSQEPTILEVDIRVVNDPGSMIGFSFIDRHIEAQYGGPFLLHSQNKEQLISAIPLSEAPPTLSELEHEEASIDGTIVDSDLAGDSDSSMPDSVRDENGAMAWINDWSWLLSAAIVVLIVLALLLILIIIRRRSRSSVTEQPSVIAGGSVTSLLPPAFATGAPYLKMKDDNRTFAIDTFPFNIGRDEKNNLVINESFGEWQTVSRHHCQITQHTQGYVIEDLGSQNKLRVQGRPAEKNLIRNGWTVTIGAEEFIFYDGVSGNGR
jgi:uncharacterized repeat protein (TIGR01451 family)